MNTAAARTSAPPPVVFRDAFGERRRIVAPTGSDTLDVLCLRSELTAVPSFEFALRERVSRLAGFRHPYFAQVRTVERLNDSARTLALISNAQAGVRISDLLATASKNEVVLDSDAALCLIRQLVTAMATFHEHAPDAAHGALGPERVVVTPNARLVIVEHVMGSAIEQLQFSEDRYWRELRVPCPRAAGLPVIDHRADVLQLGMLALALLLGRSITGEEFPARVGDAVVSARALSADGNVEALPSGLRPWLTSALQLDPRSAFASAIEAREELEKVFDRNDDLGAPSALEAFLARYSEHTDSTPMPHDALPDHASDPIAAAPSAGSAEPILDKSESASEPTWSDPRQSGQEALRAELTPPQPVAEQPLTRDPIATALRPLGSDPPAFGVPATRPIESFSRPAASYSMMASHTSSSYVSDLHAQDEEKESPHMASRRKADGRRAAIAAILFLFVAGGGTLAARKFFSAAPPTTGTVVVTTNPPGAQVLIDGKPQGISPTTLSVAAGSHALELRGSGEPRTIALDVAAGAQLSQYIEMAKGPVATGSLQVRTEPSGARISIDGIARGVSPLTIADLAPGDHAVALEGESGTTKQTVTVEAGATASLVANLAASQGGGGAPSSGGWLSVSTPKTVQLFENGRLLGSSDSERLMVPAGSHQLDIVNEALGYRSAKTVQVSAGKVSTIKIEFPKGTIALNAVPWADVWIDGEKIGETPIGNLPLTIGTHEIIFRHPDLGEQRQLATVTLTAPTRLSVDMRKKP